MNFLLRVYGKKYCGACVPVQEDDESDEDSVAGSVAGLEEEAESDEGSVAGLEEESDEEYFIAKKTNSLSFLKSKNRDIKMECP